jgi:mannose-6-phosphate isomerase
MQLDRHFVEKPWGRTDLPAIFGPPSNARIGEIWYGAADAAKLPLLVKWLFTSEKLSIQVHPSDAQAQALGQASGKEECWYIVDAEPGAVIGLGTVKPLSSTELRAASQSGEIEALMDWRPVKSGDYFYIPAGTIHAIGAGITLVEIQQYADITYRLFDYGRPRELHLDEGVSVAHAKPYADPRSGHVSGAMQLVQGPHFNLWYTDGEADRRQPSPHSPQWIIPLSGSHMGQCLLNHNEVPHLAGPHLIATAA